MKDNPQSETSNQMRLGHLPEELEHFDPRQADRSISDRIEDQVEKTPDHTAVRCGSRSLTYRQLNQAANRLARSILSLSEDEQRPVASLFGHDENSIIGFLGILKTGRIFVPLDPTYTHERLRYSIDNSQAAILVTDTAHLAVARETAANGQTILNLDDVDTQVSPNNLELHIPADKAAIINYTSGSTGKPKGVVSDHRKLNYRALFFLPEDRLTHLFSISFIASIDDIFGALMHGARLCMYDLKREGIAGLAGWMIAESITYFRPPSSILRQFNDLLPDNLRFPQVKRISLGAQAVYTEDVKRLMTHFEPECIVKFHLASTEAGRIAQYHFTAATPIHSDRLPVGYAAIGMDITIIGEDGEVLGPGEVGEIVLRSAYLAKEYWRDPDLTAATFKPDPDGGDRRLLYTGDLGRLHEDGLLEHLGRKDSQLKIRGYRIEVTAIESHLQKLGSVREVVVVPVEPPGGGDRYLAAYIVPEVSPGPSVTFLRGSMKDTFADFMIPSRFVLCGNLPRTATGKVDLAALPPPPPDRPHLSNPYLAPATDIEQKLVRVWERILGVKPVGIDDNFFDLGGDSLLAAQLFIEIEKVFEKKLPLSILYKAANVKEQAAILARGESPDDWSPLVAVQPKGEKTPLFCFPGKGGNPIRFRHLSQRLGQDQPVYMLQSIGISGSAVPLSSIEAIAQEFKQAIQSVQPDGPYYLLGSSGGGKTAYEIAQRLVDEGQQIELLAFVDTYGPGYPRRLPSTSRVKSRLFWFLQYLGKHFGNLRVAGWQGRLSYLRRYSRLGAGRIRKWLSKTFGWKPPKEWAAVERANLAAGKKYIPQPYSGRVVLFKARQQPWGIYEDPQLGWGQVGIGDLVIHEIPGHHGSILFEPRVENLVGYLNEYLG